MVLPPSSSARTVASMLEAARIWSRRQAAAGIGRARRARDVARQQACRYRQRVRRVLGVVQEQYESYQ